MVAETDADKFRRRARWARRLAVEVPHASGHYLTVERYWAGRARIAANNPSKGGTK